MARSTYLGTANDVLFARSGPLLKVPTKAVTLTFWDAETGGTQYTDLLVDGEAATEVVVAADAGGATPAVQGPDGVDGGMWVQAQLAGETAADGREFVTPSRPLEEAKAHTDATVAGLVIPATAADVGADPAGTAQGLVDGLVAAAPGTLDTLNELAAALGDDPDFAGTVLAELANKVDGIDLDTLVGTEIQTPGSETQAGLLAVDADETSALRVQQDARHSALYVGQDPQANITRDGGVAYRIDNVAETPADKRMFQITQNAAQYALKIDHYGADGHAVDIATHTDPSIDPDYTVVGITGHNTNFGTMKVVNNAPQSGGGVIAAWGTDPARTAPIVIADNWGKGDGFQSYHRAGSDAVAFRAAFDTASTFTKPVIWLPARNVSNDVILVENDAAQTSGSLMYLNHKNAASTVSCIRLANAGSGYLIDATADGFSVDGTGQIRTTQIFNISSFNNAKIIVGTTGAQITRNVSDGSAVLRVRQDSATSTGDVLRLESSGSVVRSRFDKAGTFVTKVNAAPADADLVAGEMALWFDSTNGSAKLMVKAKQADGAVKTGSVALA